MSGGILEAAGRVQLTGRRRSRPRGGSLNSHKNALENQSVLDCFLK